MTDPRPTLTSAQVEAIQRRCDAAKAWAESAGLPCRSWLFKVTDIHALLRDRAAMVAEVERLREALVKEAARASRKGA